MLALKPYFITALITVCISGCSSRDEPKLTPIFHTEIKADDSKMFSFTLVGNNGIKAEGAEDNKPEGESEGERGKGSGGKGGRGGRGKGDRQSSTEQVPRPTSRSNDKSKYLNELLYELLNEQLLQNQYCRTGYFQLEKSLVRGLINLKGECNESATAEDKARFPNKS